MPQANFLSITELMDQCNATSIEVHLSSVPNGGLVAKVGDVEVKVSRDIDKSKPMSFIYTNDIRDGCLINVKPRELVVAKDNKPLFTVTR